MNWRGFAYLAQETKNSVNKHEMLVHLNIIWHQMSNLWFTQCWWPSCHIWTDDLTTTHASKQAFLKTIWNNCILRGPCQETMFWHCFIQALFNSVVVIIIHLFTFISGIGIVPDYRLDDRGVRVQVPVGSRIFFSTSSRPALGCTQPPI
jgi:hypothetical protein